VTVVFRIRRNRNTYDGYCYSRTDKEIGKRKREGERFCFVVKMGRKGTGKNVC